jgi:transcriptional regulator with PAS, ATPase and Fis domain
MNGRDAPAEPGDGEAIRLIGDSPAIVRIREMIAKVGGHKAPVLIAGESGTGKELVARAIHAAGGGRRGRFVAVNCGAIPDPLLESELFGHARGAFTGAWRDRAGLVEEADGGSFFLDEVGDLSPPLQAKLLRVLQEKEIRRVGENRSRPVAVRFLSATHKTLEAEVAAGAFREDLFYRIRIITVEVPPLRERREDIPLLAEHFVERYAREMGRGRAVLSPAAVERLAAYAWPGNVRELQNEIQRCLVFLGEGAVIEDACLSPRLRPEGELPARGALLLAEARAEFERRFVRQALRRSDFNKTRAAAEMGLTRQGLFKLLKRHGIETPRHAPR